MSNTVFKLRRSSVAGKSPNTSTLSIGELAINLTDRKLFSSDGTDIFETGSNLTSLSVFSDITVGNSAVNTTINSTALSVKSIVANGSVGSATQVLSSNGSSIYWASPAAGSIAGSNTQIQFNDSGTANATAGFTFDKTSNTLSLGNTTVNAVVNSTSIRFGNSTVNTTVSNGNLIINGNNVSPVQSFRNKIINGNFDHWQRGTSNTSIASGQYLADRWKHVRAGTTANVSRQSFTLGQTDVPNEPIYFHRIVTTSSAGAGNHCILAQQIESVRTLAGQTATLSFWAKADASKNIAVEHNQYFGTGGSPSSIVTGIGVTTCALTTAWKKFTITVNIPSISGKTLGSDNNDYLGLNFWFDAGSNFNSRTNSLGQQSGTFDIAQVQLEAGSVATPFEMRPIGTELALCQRYYQGNKADGSSGDYGSAIVRGNNSAATGNFHYWMPFSVVMRGTPTMSVGTPTYSNAGSATFFNATRHGAEIFLSVSSGGGYAFIPWSASAEL